MLFQCLCWPEMCCFRICDGQRYVVSGSVLIGDVLFQDLCWSEMYCFRVCAGQRCVVSGFVLVRDMLFQGLSLSAVASAGYA